MSPTKPNFQSPYTPEQMKSVLKDALSPVGMPNSPLSHKSKPRSKTFESVYLSENSSSSDDARTHTHDHSTHSLNGYTLPDGQTINHTPGLGPFSSPIRALNSSPVHHGNQNPAQTYEVEAPFLQAMIGLLERQANIVPNHVLSKSDVRKMVRKEIDRRKVGENSTGKSLSSFITPSGVLASVVGIAGFAVYQRACLKHPEEMKWYVEGSLRGGLVGLVGVAVVKGVLWGVDKWRGGGMSL